MEREKIINIGPICRFGPGGEYVTNWPLEWEDPTSRPQGLFTKLLNMFVGMIEALRGNMSEQGIPYYVSKGRSIEPPRRTYAAAGTVIKHNRWICDQPGLFADDWRAGAAVKHKPKHIIRAHRAAGKKGTCFAPAEGRTLFDADFKSAKTA
jgi:hypothetical protein